MSGTLRTRTPARTRESKPPRHVRQWINQTAHRRGLEFEVAERARLLEQWQAGELQDV
jgi:hypothetical protein